MSGYSTGEREPAGQEDPMHREDWREKMGLQGAGAADGSEPFRKERDPAKRNSSRMTLLRWALLSLLVLAVLAALIALVSYKTFRTLYLEFRVF